MSRFLAGLLIAMVATVGIYFASSSMATSMAANFIRPPETKRAHITEFASAMRGATAELRVSHAKCRRLDGKEKGRCNVDAKETARIALSVARAEYALGTNSRRQVGMSGPLAARDAGEPDRPDGPSPQLGQGRVVSGEQE